MTLLIASFGAACSSSTTTEVVATDQASQPAATAQTDSSATSQESTADDSQATTTAVPLASTPLDYALISGGPGSVATTPVPCQLSGPVTAAFAASRGMELKRVSGNNCQWTEGPANTIDIHFRETAEIDVAQRRDLHGADDTVVDEAGPGTQAASYLDFNGVTERYFFVAGSRAVFLVAETSPQVTPAELRALADEVAGLIGSAVDEGQYWDAAGDFGEDPLCGVWSAEALRQMFGATSATPSSVNGCQWWMEGADNTGHQVTLGIDLYDTIEIHTRNGGSDIAIGDRGAVLEGSGIHGTLRQVAFAVGDKAMTVTVDSPTGANLADVLAANVAARLG